MKASLRITSFIFIALLVPCTRAGALVTFSNPELSQDGRLLFTAQADVNGSPSYEALFETRAGTEKIEYEPNLITCFPEKIEVLLGSSVLQIRNRYGTARLDIASTGLTWASSANKIPSEYTRLGNMNASPDGKWLCYVKQTKASKGQLVIRNAATLKEAVLVENAPFDYRSTVVKWSADSSCFLYEKDGYVYFMTPDAAFSRVQLPEEYRRIGSGFLNCVEWTGNASLIYINGDIVYRIQQNELFTRGLYSPLVGSGRIIARLPYDFDSVRDIFFCDVDGTQIVMIQDGSLVNYFSLGAQGYDYVHIKGIYSLTGLKGTPLDYRIFWTTERKPVLWIDMLGFSNSRKISSVYTLYGKMEHLLDINGCSSPVLSPDKRHIAFASGNSAYIYDTTSWMQCTRIQGEKIHSLAWTSAFSLAAGGEYTVRLWKFDFKNKTSEGRILYLSSAEKPFFDGNRISVYIKSLDKSFFYDEKKCMWIPSLAKPPATGSSMNGNFRVFTSSCRNPKFLNGIYVRSLSKKVVSYPVYRETEKNLPSPKRVAFAFDATDSAAGVAEILDTLERFGVKGTFFFNGEFIRRYPAETKQIALSGNNCASIFYSRADLLSKNFVIDADFIKRGLARNEDEFFITTGKELSLLWHAPFYKSSPLMKEASKEAGYTYVEALKNADDSVTFEDALAKKGEYKSSSELIEQITLSLKDRTVIPVNVGKAHGTRKDYLYENLDLLISSILDAGCEITDAALIAD